MPKFTPRPRKQKARQRQADLLAKIAPTTGDSNAAEQIPSSKEEKEERKRQLREDLRAQQPASKASTQKRRRLDKYIDTKLRKEENLDLIKKISQQNGNVDTSLLRSSKKLGRSREDRKEAAGRVLRQRRAGIGKSADDDKLFEAQKEDSSDETSSSENNHIPEYLGHAPAYNLHLLKTPTAFGAGLKRPLDVDNDGQPVIKRRKRSKPLHKIMEILVAEEKSWEGFASESGLSEIDAAGTTTDGESEDSAHSEHSEDAPSEGHWTDETSMEEDVTSAQDDSVWSGGDEAGGNDEVLNERSSAFKAWATQLRNDVLGFTPSTATDYLYAAKPHNTMQKHSAPKSSIDVSRETYVDREVGTVTREMNEHAIFSVVPTSSRKVFNVSVNRLAAIQEARLDLPVVAEEQKIMEAIHNNDTTIIWGTTGSGKTTQLPQFLYEAGYGNPDGPTPGMIGLTQPRGVATVSMAKRVATELGNLGGKVSYQIRFDSSVSNKTAIKFMTDGVLLREVALDFTLSKYSAIIIDEAHERSVNTDLLIGMLSRVVDTRADLAKSHESYKPLKVIIMSATLRVADLTKNTALFRRGAPPIVQVEGRQYPVTMHFTKRTQRDYLEEMFHKVSRGHKKLPAGGMLVFLTGQNEITSLAKRLKQVFASTQGASSKHAPVRVSATEASIEDEDMDLDGYHNEEADDASDSASEIRGVDNDDNHEFDIGDDPGELLKIHVLPLYSQLPTDQQMRVFEPAPNGSRLIVLATNVAETSLTIPGLRYVFDCGRVKEKHFDRSTGVQSFDIGWISKASASQRAGRAGRTGPGHCYRLYSSAIYERDFLAFTAPEIQRTPIEGVVLQLKSMGIPKVTSFPFPTPPDRDSLLKAERLLEYLRAIADGKVTDVGQELAAYPLSPRLSSMLVMGRSQGCIEDTITLVAALAVPDTFIPETQLDLKDPEINEDQRWTEADNQEVILREQRRKEYHSFHAHTSRLDRTGDAVKLLTALCDFTHISRDNDGIAPFRKYTRIKALHEASQLRSQLATIVATNHPDSIAISTTPEALLSLPTRANVHTLHHVIAAGHIDQIALRADLSPNPPDTSRKPKRVIDVPYITLFASYTHSPSDTAEEREQNKYVYIHPSSVLAHTSPEKLPQYLIYSHLSRSSPSTINGARKPKTRIHPLTPVSSAQIASLAAGTPLLEEGKPVGKVQVLERDDQARERRMCYVTPFLVGERGTMGWPLQLARKVVQRREVGKGWVTERIVG